MNKPEIFDEKIVYESKIFTVKELFVRQKNGKVKTWYTVQRIPVVCILPITSGNEVFLVSQHRVVLGKDTIELTSGFVENNEDFLKAAKRELKEETGIQAKRWDELASIQSSGGSLQAPFYLFLARDLEFGKTEFDEDEDIRVLKMSLEDAVQKVLSEEIKHAPSIVGILKADRLLRDKKI